MPSLFSKSTFSNPLILVAIGATILVAVGSVAYYEYATHLPPAENISLISQNATTSITAVGTVEPAENPDLAFESGGRVARLNAVVGHQVAAGTLLATLDTASLSAARDQAAANVKQQQAKLDSMLAGPRQSDISQKQTAVSQAQLSLTNLYQSIPNDIEGIYSGSLGAIHGNTDSLFNSPDAVNPTLVFQSSASQAVSDSATARVTINTELSEWKSEVGMISTGSSQAALESELQASLNHLFAIRSYTNTLTEALAGIITNENFPQTKVDAAQSALSSLRTSISASISTLQGDVQQIASKKLAIQSAEDDLNQTLAGSSPEDIKAQQAALEGTQAALASAEAALGNAEIIAPFSGTITRVDVKVGDIVSPNSVAVSLTPQSALEVQAYLSEIDIAHLSLGQHASVTLDAYGSTKVFDTTITTIDRSPTMQNNVPAYKITLQFVTPDPSIASGMTANITINKQ